MAEKNPEQPPLEISEIAALIGTALEQGNIVVSVDGEVADLTGTPLHGGAFEPVELPRAEEDDPSPDDGG